MKIRNMVVATDESEAGRRAVRTAVDLGLRSLARVTVLRVLAAAGSPGGQVVLAPGHDSTTLDQDGRAALGHLRRWLMAGVLSEAELDSVDLGVAYGLPGIEICRVAEQVHADLLVLGRKRHSPRVRLLLGDTADAVARRSRFPCLFVPPGSSTFSTVLAALDGSDRGMAVLNEACDFARYAGAEVTTITVERAPVGEPLELVPSLPMARSETLQTRVHRVLAREGFPQAPLAVTRGDVVERVLMKVEESAADVLAVGYHRGGPPGILEAGSVARRLVHVTPSAVLTVPL